MISNLSHYHTEIARGVWGSLPEGRWKRAEFTYKEITQFSSSGGKYEKKNGTFDGILNIPDAVRTAFEHLRAEMAKLHDNGHAWYTATFTLTPDGKFKFDFDYDHLPAFDIMPDPEDWLDEFKHYPRPELQAQIQDWIDGRVPYEEWKSMVARLKQVGKKT
ncbi:immunity protein YezG family protein [Thauera butanivorans]|uniref:immunity protein YezG family protein n=1 Tax=Thauera butanivorans TaxID=86174 RepID=UPI0009FD7609|nr:immunity protein YezG family protein [Thauera butanivorans]